MNANVQADQYSNSVMAGGPPASLRNPSFLIECGYFFTLFYAFFGDALGYAFLEFVRLAAQIFVGQRADFRFQRVDLADSPRVLLDQPIVAAAENLLE